MVWSLFVYPCIRIIAKYLVAKKEGVEMGEIRKNHVLFFFRHQSDNTNRICHA